MTFRSEERSSGVERSDNRTSSREAAYVPSGLHQEQIAFNVDKDLSGCREATNFVQKESREADGRRAACIRSRNCSNQEQESVAVWSEAKLRDRKNEKAVRQQDGLLFQGRIVPTEFEKDHQNFLAKSYWPVKGSVKEFLENRYLCFQ